MNTFTQLWRTWTHGRKLARKGAHFRCPIEGLTVEGHVEVGDHCRFRNNSTLRALEGGKIIFGSRTGCSWHCHLEAHELIHVGNYAGLAEHVVLCDTMYHFGESDGSWREVRRTTAPIIIGDNCFVGNGCFVGPGVTIGEGAVVAHHSIVTRDIPPYEIWGGAPAMRIAHRTEGVPEAVLEEFRRLAAELGIQKDRYTI